LRLHPNGFIRQRDLLFHRLAALIRNLRNVGADLEPLGFFAALLGVVMTWAEPIQAVFSKARKLLSQQRLIDLNGQAIKTFCAGGSTPPWEGFRLRAVDGATLRLPPGRTLARDARVAVM
jgi:hypothetical protein